MATRYALELRSGIYFINVDCPTGGPKEQALTFNSEKHARWWFDKFAPWVWQNGGLLVRVEVAS